MKLVDIGPMKGLKIPFLFSSLFSILIVSNAVDTITKTHSITGRNTIVSSGGSFEMGFFSLGNSQNTYLGIWYKKISPKTVVWVANREIPLVDSSGVLTVSNPGIIALVNSTSNVIWSPNVTGSTQDPVAQLMESGNFVVKDANDTSEHFLWQSFDYPCNTLLPGMKLGKNFVTGLEHHLSSWKSRDDPAPGNGIRFNGRPNLKPNTICRYEVVYTKKEVYYHYELLSPVVSRFVLSPDGVVEYWTWIDRTQEWILYLTGPTNNCDKYKLCGPNGSCNVRNLPSCGCLSKFVPRNQTEWGDEDWSNGCVRRTTLDCKSGDGFLKYSQYKMPYTRNSWIDKNMTLRECEIVCLKNCSCMAYTNLDIRGGGSGCLLWFGELIDMREYSEDGPDIYMRMASSELGPTSRLEWQEKKDSSSDLEGNLMHNSEQGHTDKSQADDLELPLFNLAGILEGGLEIAVKWLSKNSSQGLDEFKNEVICTAKLQHRNPVKLLGCCIQGEETMLIYEYMPNKSLDYFIFEHGLNLAKIWSDQTRCMLLDWPKRFHIINGTARGLLYLHPDSRLRIFHRDLKASNILLDIDTNPKISFFGLARSFGGNETEANTKRVVGTYGYMSPTYAIDGLFSVKSDEFSFGVLVLEIVTQVIASTSLAMCKSLELIDEAL
ncbi:unnamed protein product [Camellia sinensis]